MKRCGHDAWRRRFRRSGRVKYPPGSAIHSSDGVLASARQTRFTAGLCNGRRAQTVIGQEFIAIAVLDEDIWQGQDADSTRFQAFLHGTFEKS